MPSGTLPFGTMTKVLTWKLKVSIIKKTEEIIIRELEVMGESVM